jgi:hypothetical protein
MFSLEIHYLVGKEKYKDLRRDVERHQLIQIAKLGRPDKRESLRRMAGWLGSRLVMWGSMLQGHQTSTQRG